MSGLVIHQLNPLECLRCVHVAAVAGRVRVDSLPAVASVRPGLCSRHGRRCPGPGVLHDPAAGAAVALGGGRRAKGTCAVGGLPRPTACPSSGLRVGRVVRPPGAGSAHRGAGGGGVARSAGTAVRHIAGGMGKYLQIVYSNSKPLELDAFAPCVVVGILVVGYTPYIE